MNDNRSLFQFRKKQRPKTPPRQPLRTGLYVMEVVGGGLLNKGQHDWPRVEVAEWERLGQFSRVTILKVSGISRSDEGKVRDLVGEWIPTDSVVWRDE